MVPPEGVRHTVLVADDDPEIRYLIERALPSEGLAVITAADGEEALARAVADQPSVIVLDIGMPKADGFEVCRRIRAEGRTCQIPILFLTGRGDAVDRVVGLSAGADDYVVKPFDLAELVARVKTTLRRSQEWRAVSPLTGLPGNPTIEQEIRERLRARHGFALGYADLDTFKAFNDRYGFSRGDDVLAASAEILSASVWPRGGGFVGHVGGDDFVFTVAPSAVDDVCVEIINGFDGLAESFYDPQDRARGGITVEDRRGNQTFSPVVSISIGVCVSERAGLGEYGNLVRLATEMKGVAKRLPGSSYAVDRRRSGT